MSRATILALSLVAALALSSGAMAQGGGGGGGGGGAGGASGASGEPLATRVGREAVRAATALVNRPAGKAVRLAILPLNRPGARAKIALIPQGRELGRVPRRGACAEASPQRLNLLRPRRD